MRVLITGITGFIGMRLAEQIRAVGDFELVGMARDKNKIKLLEKQGIEMRYADLSQPDSLHDLTRDVDSIVHLAALMRFHAPRDRLFQQNTAATKILAEDAVANGVGHFIYISSTEAMRPVADPPGDETTPCHPTYEYGWSKLASEQWLLEQYAESGFPVTIVRPTGVIGPGDLYVTLSTIRAIARGKLRLLPGKADKLVHFTSIDDIVDGILKVITRQDVSIGETFILAGDDYVTYKELLSLIAWLCGIPPPNRSVPIALAKMYVKFVEWRNRKRGIDDFFWHASLVNDITVHRAYSNAKAKLVLGFRPLFSLEFGLAQTIAVYRSNGLL